MTQPHSSHTPIRRAVLSVSDKTGLIPFARALHALGVELISTGGTQKAIAEAGIPVIPIETYTGLPEMLGGRVKTLHPKIFAGILARREVPADLEAIARHGFPEIDLVVVNLYPFSATISKPGTTFPEAVEMIDIGGPSLLRAAAKNHDAVTVVVDPADYQPLLGDLDEHDGATCARFRRKLARKVFAHTSQYDAMIAGYFLAQEGTRTKAQPAPATETPAAAPAAADDHATDALFPPIYAPVLVKRQSLRYGENPHQAAAFYVDPSVEETSLSRAVQLNGKELSYNNLLDADGALEMVRDFAPLAPAAAVVVKHANPCGIAIDDTLEAAYRAARECDPEAAFGGIVALSVPVDAAAATALAETFLEVIIAPDYSPEAVEILRAKKNLRVLAVGAFKPKKPLALARGIVGGTLVMDRDLGAIERDGLKTVTKRQPTPADVDALLFAWRCVKWVKSNAIVYTDRRTVIGIGAGQMSRADSARLGRTKARKSLDGAYMASDAFFPFRDSIDEAAKAGIRAVIQPGGSVRDAEVIAAADEHDMVMLTTGMRHFRH